MKKLIGIFILLLWNSDLQAQSTFYQGKTITVIAGVSAGSVYDLYARLLVQSMGKYIPGNPKFVVQNMTGAGSIIGVRGGFTFCVRGVDTLKGACVAGGCESR